MINNFSEPINSETPPTLRVRLHPFIQNEFNYLRFNPFFIETFRSESINDEYVRELREHEAFRSHQSDSASTLRNLNTELGLGIKKDQEDIYQNGLDITGFVMSINITDSITSAPFNSANIILAMPSGLQNYIMQGYEPQYDLNKAGIRTTVEDYARKKERAFTVFRQIKAGGWISIDAPQEDGSYSVVFMGKIGGFEYSSLVGEDGTFEQTPMSITCEGFIQPLTQSQFRVRVGQKDLEALKDVRESSAKAGGGQSISAVPEDNTATVNVGIMGAGTYLSLRDWSRYIITPLAGLASQNISLGVLFTKFLKFFSGMTLPTSLAKPYSDKFTAFTPKSLGDSVFVAYQDRHFVGTIFESQKCPAPIGSNLKALGGASGKSGVWSFITNTFVSDLATMECFTTMLRPKGHSKAERNANIIRLVKGLLASAPHSNLIKAKPDLATELNKGIELFEKNLNNGSARFSLTILGGFFAATRKNLDSLSEINEFDLDLLQASVVMNSYAKLGAIPTVVYRLKPLCPGTFINATSLATSLMRSRPKSILQVAKESDIMPPTASERLIQLPFGDQLKIENAPSAIEPPSPIDLEAVATEANVVPNPVLGIGTPAAVYAKQAAEAKLRYQAALGKATADYDKKAQEYQRVKLLREAYTLPSFKYSESATRLHDNFIVLDDSYLTSISFAFSERNRINAVVFDSSFTSSSQTKFDLSALEIAPDPILDAPDIRRDGLRVYEGSFPFLHTVNEDTSSQSEGQKKIILLPQAMAERAFMLLANDHEFSSGSIQMVYHEGYEITPGMWGLIKLRNPEDRELVEATTTDSSVTASSNVDPQNYFEFYINSVTRVVQVDQVTGAIYGSIVVNYTRGSYGRKTNMFKYYDIDSSSTTLRSETQPTKRVIDEVTKEINQAIGG